MGKKTRTITEYYCDLCNAMCYESDSHINVATSKQDMMGGTLYLRGKLTVSDALPDSAICKSCMYEHLTKYLKKLSN